MRRFAHARGQLLRADVHALRRTRPRAAAAARCGADHRAGDQHRRQQRRRRTCRACSGGARGRVQRQGRTWWPLVREAEGLGQMRVRRSLRRAVNSTNGAAPPSAIWRLSSRAPRTRAGRRGSRRVACVTKRAATAAMCLRPRHLQGPRAAAHALTPLPATAPRVRSACSGAAASRAGWSRRACATVAAGAAAPPLPPLQPRRTRAPPRSSAMTWRRATARRARSECGGAAARKAGFSARASARAAAAAAAMLRHPTRLQPRRIRRPPRRNVPTQHRATARRARSERSGAAARKAGFSVRAFVRAAAAAAVRAPRPPPRRQAPQVTAPTRRRAMGRRARSALRGAAAGAQVAPHCCAQQSALHSPRHKPAGSSSPFSTRQRTGTRDFNWPGLQCWVAQVWRLLQDHLRRLPRSQWPCGHARAQPARAVLRQGLRLALLRPAQGLGTVRVRL